MQFTCNYDSRVTIYKCKMFIRLATVDTILLFFKWANPGLFFIYFRLFTHYNFYNK